MEPKEVPKRVSYHIEHKPDGRLIAHPDDPQQETIEAATMDDLLSQMSSKLPVNLALVQREIRSETGSVHVTTPHGEQEITYGIEAKPEGGFVAHFSDAGTAPVEGTTLEEVHKKAMSAARIAMGLAGAQESRSVRYEFVRSSKNAKDIDKEMLQKLQSRKTLPSRPIFSRVEVIVFLLFFLLIVFLIIWRK